MPGKLRVSTQGDRKICLVRDFDAPRPLVWDCHTKPELVRKWVLDPQGSTMTVCEIDLRVGGEYRYMWAKNERVTMGMGGVFRDVDEPKTIGIWTGDKTIVVQIFQETKGRTRLTMTTTYTSKESRDGALATPILEGIESGYLRLDKLVGTLAGS